MGRAIDHSINRRAIALSLEALRRIPTVILASGGMNKSRVIAAVVKAKLVLGADLRRADRDGGAPAPAGIGLSDHAMALFLGIDIGTSGVKAVLIDERDQVAAEASAPLVVSRPQPLWSEQAPRGLVAAPSSATLDALAQRHPQPMAARARRSASRGRCSA